MEFDPHDQDIIRLLTRLKDVHVEYPENMLVARRQSYLKQMAEMEFGMGGGRGIRSTRLPSQSSTISALLETALIVAIVAEASIMTYFYREKLVDFFQGLTAASRTEEVTPPSVIPISSKIQEISLSPAISSTAVPASPTGTTETPTSAPIPAIVGDSSSTPPGVSVNSTPVPNGDSGNSGHHYGQTPKPERTKENNGNNDKPTKPPKDKPTKTK
jgi:hypothetical protein